ncbi:hypothetical protein BMS3Abin07_02067 [bacterium BMS3Abin07]|nr:hypothetical protein BMS3Abin07_02067 [bacterium BMS3Abin07]GBE32592.1 hypothetical protein BMS3Bbin05_01508 [bacterium BMS3Bbin05]HDO21378.1 hypothetical protein [Nitrospirota bacterium]HDZ87251.1 hypothetical protein [Nitrospirota bacterium]
MFDIIKTTTLLLLIVFTSCGGGSGAIGSGEGTETAYENSSFGVHGAYGPSPFFQKRMGFTDDEYLAWVSGHMQSINAHFTRRNTLLIRDVVDPDINIPDDYDWDTLRTDKTLINIYKSGNNIHALHFLLF